MTFFKCIIREKNSFDNYIYQPFLNYEKIISIIKESKCIVDIPQNGQKGITLRVLEALFFRKKLYTTNTSICEYDFYDKDNVFIANIDSDKDLYDFVNSPFCPKEEVLKRYTFDD